jgi:retinol dehydrogenase 12
MRQVFIVTGSNTGVGKEVARILYSKNAKVYIAARSEEKANSAIEEIKKAWPNSTGSLIYQYLDLADLTTIKPSVERFKQKDSKLHGLFNNAAVQALAAEPPNNVTAQGHEIHLGVNALGTFLFTKLLTPTLIATAKTEPPNTVRVVWVSSLGLEVCGEEHYGITTDYLKYWPKIPPLRRYGVSKAGNWLYAVEFANRYKADGIVSVPCNPGHLRSDLYRDGSFLLKAVVNTFIAYPSVYGAYTELYSALSPDITIQESGSWSKLCDVLILDLSYQYLLPSRLTE